MAVVNWNFAHSTQLDILNLFLSMLKVRTPPLMSTVLYKTFTVELDCKLLIDLRFTICMPHLTKMKPFYKLVCMMTFKLIQLRDYIRVEFPNNFVIAEINNLAQHWLDIFIGKIQPILGGTNIETVFNHGRAIYAEIEKFKKALTKEKLQMTLDELQMIK